MNAITRHEFRALDPSGDVKVSWDPAKADEVESARKHFTDLRGKGYTAFAVNKDGRPGNRIEQFDPKLEAMILAPRVTGG